MIAIIAIIKIKCITVKELKATMAVGTTSSHSEQSS